MGFNGAMAADMREWAIEGYGGRVAIRIGPPARTYGGDGPMSDRMTAEFSAELPEAWVDQLAVVGTPESARARLASLHGAGADQVALIPVGDDRVAALERLAALV